MTMMNSLWGNEFSVDVKSVIEKAKHPKKVKSTEQALRSKSVSVFEKIDLVTADVYRILGRFGNDTRCITSYDELVKYFDNVIENGIISIDTETGDEEGKGSLDTIQCDLMGACIYTPGQKNVYVPVSHRYFDVDAKGNIILKEKLENQLTTEQIATQLQRLLDKNIKCVFTNATFDIEVLFSTCGIKLSPYWDTIPASKLLDENELAGLKAQYKLHVDKDAEKYDIEHLFKGLPYAIFKPEVFALYAATDAKKTFDLYEWQRKQFELPENKEIYELLRTIEIPILDVVVDMELLGINVDAEYAKKMSVEFHRRLAEVQDQIDDELKRLEPQIMQWKLSPEANEKPKVYPAKKTKMSEEDIAEKFPLIDEKGKHYKLDKKSPVDKLSDPIDIGSTTQLQILLYDILKVPQVDKMDPRGTGADILDELANTHHIKICELLIKKRGIDILINNFIDKMPELIKKKTGKLHARFNSYGAATGRFSSSDPSLQQIPSHEKSIRMMFMPGTEYHKVVNEDNVYKVKYYDDVMIDHDVWKRASELSAGDKILNSEGTYDTINYIELIDGTYYIYVHEEGGDVNE